MSKQDLDRTTSTDDDGTTWLAVFPADGEIGEQWIKSNAFLNPRKVR